MLSQLSVRDGLHALFKRRRTALVAGLAPLVIFALAVLPKKHEFESTASLMVKVLDQDAVAPDTLAEQQGRSAASASAMAKQIISSEQLIVSSEDVRKRALLSLGVLTVYPDLAREPPDLQQQLALDRLGKDLIVKVSGETSVLALSVFNRSPQVAQRILRAVIAAAVEKQAAVMRDPRTQFLNQRLQAARSELDEAQQALLKFKQESHITSFEEERTLLLRQRDEVESSLASLRAQLVAAEGRGRTLQTSLNTTDQVVATSDENEAVRNQLDRLHEQVEAARARLNTLAQRAPGSQEYVEQQAALSRAQLQYDALREEARARVRRSVNPLSERIGADLSNARSEASASERAVAERTAQLREINERLATLDSRETQLSELERRRAVADQDYRAYLQRARSARIVSDMNAAGITNLSVVQRPTLPMQPARPKKLMLFLVALLASLICSIGSCLLLEMLDDRPSLPDQVERLLGAPVLVSINKKGEQQPAESNSSRLASRGVAYHHDGSYGAAEEDSVLSRRELSELINSLTAVLPANAPQHVVGVISTLPGEGVSTVARALATAAADMRQGRVLLCSTQGEVTRSIERAPFLFMETISAEGAGEHAPLSLGEVEGESLVRVASGQADHGRSVVRALTQPHTFVVIDLPPAKHTNLGVALSKSLDGVVLVVEAENARARALRSASKNIEKFGGKILGVAFNKRRYHIPSSIYRLL